jgi:hypothetical protein
MWSEKKRGTDLSMMYDLQRITTNTINSENSGYASENNIVNPVLEPIDWPSTKTHLLELTGKQSYFCGVFRVSATVKFRMQQLIDVGFEKQEKKSRVRYNVPQYYDME